MWLSEPEQKKVKVIKKPTNHKEIPSITIPSAFMLKKELYLQ